MLPSRLLLVLALLITSILRAAEPAPLRAALLGWEAVPERTDVQRVVADLVVLAQVELSAEPGVEWVERAELDKVLAEAGFSLGGAFDPRSALRVGHLASADIIVTGLMDASDPAASKLLLEAVEVKSGDLLARVETPLPPRPHRHQRLRDEDRIASTGALRKLLSNAAARRAELTGKQSLALLFFANTGPSSRLDTAGERLAEALRDAVEKTGGRALRFPRAAESADERDLAVLGLAEADPESWQKIADLYVWGEYKELPAEGVAFEATPVEASLTIWDGASPPRAVEWRGVVAEFPRAAETFAPPLAAALRQSPGPRSASAREEAAKRILDRVDLLEGRHPALMRSADFWKTDLGKNFYRHRLDLLQTAAFLAPEDSRTAERLYSAKWADPVRGNLPETLWEKYLDRSALDRRFPAGPLPRTGPRPAMRENAFDILNYTLRRFGEESWREREGMYRAGAELAADEWAREIERRSEAARRAGTPEPALITEFGLPLGYYHFSNAFKQRLVERTWPVFAPVFGATFARDPEAVRKQAKNFVRIFESFGQEDVAFRRVTAALEIGSAAAAPSSRPDARPVPRDQNPDPAPVAPEWGGGAGAPPVVSVRKLEWRPVTRGAVTGWPVRPAEIRPRLLGYDGHRLWIDAPPLADLGQAERVRHRVATLAPFSQTIEPVPAPPELGARLAAVTADEDGVYFASEYEGLWLAGPTAGTWRRFEEAEGLPSSSIAGVVSTPSGPVVVTTAPQNILARLDRTSGSWISMGVFPAAAGPGNSARNPSSPGAPADAGFSSAPRLAVAGDWVLASFDRPVLRNLRNPATPDPIEARRARVDAERRLQMEQIRQGKAPPGPMKPISAGWRLWPAESVFADEESFWLAGEFGLVRLALSRLDEEVVWEKDRPIHALAGSGPFILVAFSSPLSRPEIRARDGRMPETKIGIFDKRSGRWVHEFSVPDAVVNLVAAPGVAWASGAHLHEIDLRRLDPQWRSAAFPATDPAMRVFGFADQRPFEAIVKGDATTLRAVLAEAPLPVAATPATGLAPLHLAASVSTLEIVDLLLATGADPNVFSTDGRTPLAFAAARGDMAVVERLLTAGADPDAQGRPHNRRLMLDPLKPAPRSAIPPVQPGAGRAEILPDGRARLHWQAPPDSAMSYSLYRKDSPAADAHLMAARHGHQRSGWTNIGRQVESSIPGDARAWIDTLPRPAGSTCVYTLVAETGEDRFGPPAPTPLVALDQPAEPQPAPSLTDSTPAFVDSTPLQQAAWAGHAQVVGRLLAAGADLATTSAAGHGATHFAVLGGHDEILRTLLRAGAPLELVATGFAKSSDSARDTDGLHAGRAGTVLHYVYLAHRNRALFEELLAAGANQGSLPQLAARLGREDDVAMLRAAERRPFQSLHAGQPSFVAAYLAGRRELARRLRDAEFSPNAPGWPDESRTRIVEDTLMIAVKANDLELTRWLLQRGAKPRSQSENSHLGRAILAKNPELVRALVEHGAAPKQLPSGLLAAITDPEIREALSISRAEAKLSFPWDSSRSYSSVAREVGRPGQASPEALAADAALHEAAARGDVAGIRAALAAGAHVDAKAGKGWTALIHALAARHVEAARALIDAGASLNFVTHQGSPPIVFAAAIGDLRLIEEMLDLGADPDLALNESSSALHVALVNHPDVARLLVARGAHPESIIHVGGLGDRAPPIFRMARAGELAAIKLAVELGADPRRALWRPSIGEPTFGLTALPYAAASNDVATLDYFIELGLDLHWTNKHGYSALDWALRNNADRTAARLRSLGVKSHDERGPPPKR